MCLELTKPLNLKMLCELSQLQLRKFYTTLDLDGIVNNLQKTFNKYHKFTMIFNKYETLNRESYCKITDLSNKISNN